MRSCAPPAMTPTLTNAVRARASEEERALPPPASDAHGERAGHDEQQSRDRQRPRTRRPGERQVRRRGRLCRHDGCTHLDRWHDLRGWHHRRSRWRSRWWSRWWRGRLLEVPEVVAGEVDARPRRELVPENVRRRALIGDRLAGRVGRARVRERLHEPGRTRSFAHAVRAGVEWPEAVRAGGVRRGGTGRLEHTVAV